MNNVKIIGEAVPNMPWQERPLDEKNGMPLWRYSDNPVIGRNPAKGVARIFNSAVMPYKGEFIGVFRGEQTNKCILSILEEARMLFAGNLIKKRFRFRMKREMTLCRNMRMIQDW